MTSTPHVALALIRKAARQPWADLVAALADVDPPCRVEPDRWFAFDALTTNTAVAGCLACPAMTECGAYARSAREPAGVWGAVVHPITKRRGRPPTPPTPTEGATT